MAREACVLRYLNGAAAVGLWDSLLLGIDRMVDRICCRQRKAINVEISFGFL